MIQGWAREAGEDCTVEFRIRDCKSPVMCTDDSDPWWRAFSSACTQRYIGSLALLLSLPFAYCSGMKVEKEIFPAATDSQVIRPVSSSPSKPVM